MNSDAVSCALAGIAAVDPARLVEEALAGHRFGPRVSLFAAGKAAAAMASAAADVLGPFLRRGVVIAPSSVSIPGAPIVSYRGGHPIPTEEGVRGAESLVRIVESLVADDVLLCLISGGASALMTLPAHRIALEDVRDVTRLLLRAGATIDELNCVRKHIDRLKGGRLAALVFPARSEALVLSDVVGDSLATIASGPTVPDPTTVADAIAVLTTREIWGATPRAIRDHLEHGGDESPKPGDVRFAYARSRVIGSNAIAAEAARARAEQLGYSARVVTTRMVGEAREVGTAVAKAVRGECDGLCRPAALIFGGETTVTVRGTGLGGRNQELALAAALELDGHWDATVASIGTDGIDGPTDAAGAVADGATLARARDLGVNALHFLANNDSYRFWGALGGLVVTGPTGTNVMDLVVATARPSTATSVTSTTA
ncbi:MAG: glycerate kinase type-2 family protein [Gemmatimonadaceae bacterium]